MTRNTAQAEPAPSMNRRQVICAGTAAALGVAAGLSGTNASRASTGYAQPSALYKVIYDERFETSASFARHACDEGARCHAIRGDVTSLWYDDLYHRWRESPVAVGGMTNHAALFCLGILAQEAGMRVVYRAEHRPEGLGISHQVLGTAMMQSRAVAQFYAAREWTRAAASLVTRYVAAQSSTNTRQTFLSPGTIEASSLISWVIAPRRV